MFVQCGCTVAKIMYTCWIVKKIEPVICIIVYSTFLENIWSYLNCKKKKQSLAGFYWKCLMD